MFQGEALLITSLGDPGKRLLFPLEPGETFRITYTHSVDLLPVEEVFANKDGSIVLVETSFRSFGAGMGLIEGRGVYVEDGDTLRIVDIMEAISPFVLRVGEISDHHLHHRGETYALVAEFGSRPQLDLRITRLGCLEWAVWRVWAR